MKKLMILATIALSVCNTATAAEQVQPAQEQPGPAAGSAPAHEGLADLESMTFDCPGAALNAAAREAAKAPSQGRYQFSYFKIISGSAHGYYEVGFTSNYTEEPDLRYCVSVYCQQGWDPDTTTSINFMSDESQPNQASAADAAPHVGNCGEQHTPVQQ